MAGIAGAVRGVELRTAEVLELGACRSFTANGD
jgi:hypothetical protein